MDCEVSSLILSLPFIFINFNSRIHSSAITVFTIALFVSDSSSSSGGSSGSSCVGGRERGRSPERGAPHSRSFSLRLCNEPVLRYGRSSPNTGLELKDLISDEFMERTEGWGMD